MTVKIIIFQDREENTINVHSSEPVQVVEFYRHDDEIDPDDSVIVDGFEWEISDMYQTSSSDFNEIWQKVTEHQAEAKRNEKRTLEIELNKKKLEMEEIKERLKKL